MERDQRTDGHQPKARYDTRRKGHRHTVHGRPVAVRSPYARPCRRPEDAKPNSFLSTQSRAYARPYILMNTRPAVQPPPASTSARHARQERLHAGARRAARLLLLRQPLPGRPLRRLVPDGRVPPAAHLLQPVRRRQRLRPRALARQPPPRVLRRQPLRAWRPRGRTPPPAVRQVQTARGGRARDDPVLRRPRRLQRRGGGRRGRGRGAGDELRSVRRRQVHRAGAPSVPRQGPRDRPPRLGPAGLRRLRRRRQRRRGRRIPGGLQRRRRRGPVRHRAPLQEAHRGRPLQRPLPQELRALPLPGEGGPAERGGVLLARDTGGPERRRAAGGVRQAGVGGAPRPGPRIQLLRPGRQVVPAQHPRARRAGRVPLGHGGRRRRRARRGDELRRVRRCSLGHGVGDELNLCWCCPADRSSFSSWFSTGVDSQ